MFDFLLVGRLSNYLPYIIVPFKDLGEQGIGMGRGKFSLAMIDAIQADGGAVPIYRESDGVVHSVGPIHWGELARSFSLPVDGRVTSL